MSNMTRTCYYCKCKVIQLMSVMFEILIYIMIIICGLRKELTQNDPKNIGFLERNIDFLL